jgi:beta-alanine degradation protein BauB
MSRFMDMALGAVLGASITGAAIVLAEAPTMDPVKLMPQYFKVRLDNARVRVLEFHLKPGEREVMHSHPEGIVFPLTSATVRNISPDGSATTRTYVGGDVMWRDSVTHMGENIGNSEAHFLAVELKNCVK